MKSSIIDVPRKYSEADSPPGIFLTFLDVAKKLGYQIVPCAK